MAFTKSQIASIEELAGQLKKWADEQPYSPASTSIIRISPSWLYKDEILLLLAEMPGLGGKVERDFTELDEQVREYESWRCKEVTEKNEDDFRMAVDNLKGALYDLAETFTRVVNLTRDNMPQNAGDNRLTDTEKNILEALGTEHMTGPAVLKKAGYDNSSHYRTILSNLVKRGILGNDDTGYFRRNT